VATKWKVIVAMSGGVDSSVAAALLAKDFEVVGLHITKRELPGISEEIERRDADGALSAQAVAKTLGIPLRLVEAGREFDGLVGHFCREYNAGRTPNPCVTCNVSIKWRLLLETAEAEGADFVATGHYAKAEKRGATTHLVRGGGGQKDQTYFLHRLAQNELMRTVFPLADRGKPETRAIARELGLPSGERNESQEICFVGAGGYREIIEMRTPGEIRGGEVVDARGQVIGRHEGYQFYTIGQRKGLGIALGKPAYVVKTDARTARVTLGGEDDLLCRLFEVRDVNWVVPPAPETPFKALVRIRYSHAGAPALVTPEGGRAKVEFEAPVRAVTPGQAAVFYREDEVIGGGWIAGRAGSARAPEFT